MIEPAKVREAAKMVEDENNAFRAYLREHAGPRELDQHFLALHRELFAEYDCCQCNNCCRSLDIPVGEIEVERIATYLEMKSETFVEKYLVKAEEAGFEMQPPCSFLSADGKCRIQECKPEECRNFPYTDKPDRLTSLYSVLSFAEECPILFELIERLKVIYDFPKCKYNPTDAQSKGKAVRGRHRKR